MESIHEADIKARRDSINNYREFLKENVVASFDRGQALQIEQTVKLCELVISINIGILGAIGIVSAISSSINLISKLILVMLISIVLFVTYKAFQLRSDILEIGMTVANDKGSFGDSHIKKLIGKTRDLLKIESPKDFNKEMESLKKEEIDKLAKINLRLNEKGKVFSKELSQIKYMTFLVLILVSAFIFSELLVFDLLDIGISMAEMGLCSVVIQLVREIQILT